jgi:hypothetical protein
VGSNPLVVKADKVGVYGGGLRRALRASADHKEALSAFRAAVSTPVRYDLELADGTWVDSRFAARRALSGLLAANRMASR